MEGNLVNLNELIVGDRLFDIPVYQRNYAWEIKNLQDLWEDLYYLDVSKKHYFGTVLLKDSDKVAVVGLRTLKRLDVIDGQQRLTTILILLREIISQAKAVDDEELHKQAPKLEEDYLRPLGKYKLNPQSKDGDFFREYVIDELHHLKEGVQTLSQHRLVIAREYFRERLKEEKELRSAEFVKFLVELKRKVDELQVIQYLVKSDADSIRIFETVNDRGRALSDLEKTKSFLMHSSYLGMQGDGDRIEGRLREINGRFSRMYEFFEDVSGSKDLRWLDENSIQRYHFINFVTHEKKQLGRYLDNLKDLIRGRLRQDADGCVEYIRDYAKDLEMSFFAVQDMVRTREKGGELGKLLDKTLLVGRLGNVLPLMIASWLKFGHGTAEMSKILALIEAFAFRVYTVGKFRSDTGQSRLYTMAYKVQNGQLDFNDLIGELESINWSYSNRSQFEANLRLENFFRRLTSRDMKYLLSEYEIHLSRVAKEELPLSQDLILSSRNFQVEHIWPQHPAELAVEEKKHSELEVNQLHSPTDCNYCRIKAEHMANVHKLGNLTITKWNQALSNKSFSEKKLKYVCSSLRVQRELAGWNEWNSDTIKEREDKIVEFALKRWSV